MNIYTTSPHHPLQLWNWQLMTQRGLKAFTFAALTSASAVLSADEFREDFDLDNDGLIEVTSIADLRQIHGGNSYRGTVPRGVTLYGKNTGCPQQGCFGYELSNDIDFAEETARWSPAGYFSGVFEGNGHSIKNFVINGDESVRGLFENVQSAIIRNLHITGDETSVIGSVLIGGLATSVRDSYIVNSSFSGTVAGRLDVGGLVGVSENSTFVGNHVSAEVVSASEAYVASRIGGLVGQASNSVFIANSADVTVSGIHRVGGLIGEATDTTIIANSVNGIVHGDESVKPSADAVGAFIGHSDNSVVEASYSAAEVDSAALPTGTMTLVASYVRARSGAVDAPDTASISVSEEQLRCPTSANDESCANISLYENWDQYADFSETPYWTFGDSASLPYFNANLEFGIDLALIDEDLDGVIDGLDDFASFPEASIDRDRDGYPDEWNTDCDTQCQNSSPLTIDAFPLDAAAAIDEDGDGKPDMWNPDCSTSCKEASDLVLDDDVLLDTPPNTVAGTANIFWLCVLGMLTLMRSMFIFTASKNKQ